MSAAVRLGIDPRVTNPAPNTPQRLSVEQVYNRAFEAAKAATSDSVTAIHRARATVIQVSEGAQIPLSERRKPLRAK